MFKQEFKALFPNTDLQEYTFTANPMHLREVSVMILYEQKQECVVIKYPKGDIALTTLWMNDKAHFMFPE